MKSSEIRDRLSARFGRKVGKGALLRDKDISAYSEAELTEDHSAAMKSMAELIGMPPEKFQQFYSPDEFDCDDFADLYSAIMRAISRKRSMGAGNKIGARPVYSCALERDHTMVLALTDEKEYFIEPQTGEISDKGEKVLQIY